MRFSNLDVQEEAEVALPSNGQYRSGTLLPELMIIPNFICLIVAKLLGSC